MKAKKFVWAVLAVVFALSLAAFAACDDDETKPNDGDKPETVAVTEVTLNQADAAMLKGENVTLTATVKPDNAADKTLTWTTSDEDVATVANGVVTAVAEGDAVITAKAGDKTATCAVSVVDGVRVADAEQLLAAVKDADNAGKVILLSAGTYSLTESVYIEQDLMLCGAGKDEVVLQPTGTWTNATGSKGYASVITVTNGANVTISDLTVKDAQNVAMTGPVSGTDYGHGINAAFAGEVVIENVAVQDNAACGIVVNTSDVTLKNVSTSGNGWGGVNVDHKGTAEQSTSLTVDAACAFGEQVQIYCDGNMDRVTVTAEGYTSAEVEGVTVWTK